MTAFMTRREALAALTGGAAAFLTGAQSMAGADYEDEETNYSAAEPEGCLIQAEHLTALGRASFGRHRPGDPLRTGTGNSTLDRGLGHALTNVKRVFSQNPGFGFYDDAGRPNAYAYSGTIVSDTQGTVGFGSTLFRELLRRFNDGGVSVMAVMAHEFGHISQFGARRTYQGLKSAHHTVKFVELHADLLAGYFLGWRKQELPSMPVIAALEHMYSIGDFKFNDPHHHGTPSERVWATSVGYGMGSDRLGLQHVFSRGAEIVLS